MLVCIKKGILSYELQVSESRGREGLLESVIIKGEEKPVFSSLESSPEGLDHKASEAGKYSIDTMTVPSRAAGMSCHGGERSRG